MYFIDTGLALKKPAKKKKTLKKNRPVFLSFISFYSKYNMYFLPIMFI